MVNQTTHTQEQMDMVKKYLPKLLKGQCPKSKKIKKLLGDAISWKYAEAVMSDNKKISKYLWGLLCVIYPENREQVW